MGSMSRREVGGEGSAFELCENERGSEADHVLEKKRVSFS